MKRIECFAGNLIFLFLFSLLTFSCKQKVISVHDENNIFRKTNAPVFVQVNLNKNEISAGKDGRLTLIDPTNNNSVPVQLEISGHGENTGLIFMFPENISETNEFKLVENKSAFNSALTASVDSANGQIVVQEDGKKVLQYNYQTVYEKDVIRRENDKNEPLVFPEMSGVYFEEYLKSHPEYKNDTVVTGSIYSVPRSDYIHPLFGLEGEMLTSDWPDGGHPHHRGIFWAWPEVEYEKERGDIYALQRVFARPTGNIKLAGGQVFAEIDAENLWMWEDKEPIVNEHAVIRIYHSTTASRIIDLTIKLLALKDSVTIATRFTNSYGGLNIRMQTPENQNILFFTDRKGSDPLRAWSDFNGIFEGNKSTSGLMVLQHKDNPEYPGEWKEYPELAWVQPTFPTPNTRYLLSKEEQLVLRYRLIIYSGGKQNEDYYMKNWDAYHSILTPFKID